MLLRVNIFLVTAALVFLQVAGMAVPDELEKDIGEIVEPRIVGGHPAKKTQFPFVVSLRSKTSYNFSNGHFCGGTIISKTHILTSAHCANIIKPNPSAFYVTAGSTYLKDKRIKKYEIKSIATHEDYNPYSAANDVGLITLAKKVRFSKKYIKAKKIVKRVPKSGVKCFISGWGTYGGNDYFYHDKLMFAKVPISDTKYCVAQYSGAVNPKTMICAGLKKGGVDTCSGDLGGPLICNKGIAGIASWGRGCGMPGYPGVYTNAHTYIPWLKHHTKGLFYSDDVAEEDDSGEYDDSHETEAEENLKAPENVSANEEESVNEDETEHQDISGLLAAQQ